MIIIESDLRVYRGVANDLLMRCSKLVKLDLSNQAIVTVPQLDSLRSLRILYLHQNQIRQVSLNLNINYLSLFLNPVASQASLRRQMVQSLKKLWAMDFNAVTDLEKYNYQYNKNSRLPWPLVSDQEDYHLELHVIGAKYIKCSAVLMIQKTFRMFTHKKLFKQLKVKQLTLNKQVRLCVDQWKNFVKNKRDLNLLLKDQLQLQLQKVKQIVHNYRSTRGKIIQETRAIKLIIRVIKAFKAKNSLIINSIGHNQTYKLYFSKEQIGVFYELMQCVYRKIQLQPMKQMLEYRAQYQEADQGKHFKIYHSDVITYRLPTQQQLLEPFQQAMLTFGSHLAKVSMCLQQRKLAIIRAWLGSAEVHVNQPFIQAYQEKMPERKKKQIYKLTPKEYQKYIYKLKEINRFCESQYRQLYVVTLPLQCVRELVVQIRWYNLNNDTYFVPYFENQLLQAVAALKIQRMYRAVKRKSMTIGTIIHELMKERAIILIQKWVKGLKYQHHTGCLKQIYHRIKFVTQPTLCIKKKNYIDIKLPQLQFKEQTSPIYYGNGSISITGFPNWMQLQMETQANLGDIYHVLHHGAELNTQDNYLLFTYNIIEEARLRLAILMLMTYQFKGQTFIDVYLQKELTFNGKIRAIPDGSTIELNNQKPLPKTELSYPLPIPPSQERNFKQVTLHHQYTQSTHLKTFQLADRFATTTTTEVPAIKHRSTNQSRAGYRNRSLNLSRNHNQVDYFMTNIQRCDTSYHLDSSRELDRQKKYREQQQNKYRTEQIERIRQFKITKQNAQLDKSFEQQMVNCTNVVSRQGERYQQKLKSKIDTINNKQQVQQMHDQSIHIREIIKLNTAIKLEQSKSKKHHCQIPPVREVHHYEKRSSSQQKVCNKYIHSVLPEEIYPLQLK